MTAVPAVGAAPVSVTVPVLDVPPITLLGLRVSELTVAGFTLRVAALTALL